MKLYICDGCGKQWLEDPPFQLRAAERHPTQNRYFCDISCVAAWAQRTVEREAEAPVTSVIDTRPFESVCHELWEHPVTHVSTACCLDKGHSGNHDWYKLKQAAEARPADQCGVPCHGTDLVCAMKPGHTEPHSVWRRGGEVTWPNELDEPPTVAMAREIAQERDPATIYGPMGAWKL